MSIDALQNKIRKKKNPSAVVLAPNRGMIPEGMEAGEYLCSLLAGLKDLIPAVRLDPAAFWISGCADAFVRLFEQYGHFGQFIDNETGEILIPGSFSGMSMAAFIRRIPAISLWAASAAGVSWSERCMATAKSLHLLYTLSP